MKIKHALGLTCLAASSWAVSVSAEITGSGHQVLGCDGRLSVNYFVDQNNDGVRDAGEAPISNVAVSITIYDEPQYGTDVLHTDENGNVLFFNMCENDYTIETSLHTVSSNVEFVDSVFEEGDGDVDDAETIVSSSRLMTIADIDDDETISLDYRFTQDECGLELLAGCASEPSENVPSSPDYDCDDPVEELSMIWNGGAPVRVRAHLGKLDAPVIADIDNVAPGMLVRIAGYTGTMSNDIIWELYSAGTLDKIGESSFHLSCSDNKMNGPEDCGQFAGDGKNNDKCTGGDDACLNSWVFEGLVDKNGEINCNQDYPTDPLAGAASACHVSGEGQVNYQYRLSNVGNVAVDVDSVVDSQLGPLPGIPANALQPGDSQVFSFADTNAQSMIRTIVANSTAAGTACSVATNVAVTVDPAASTCNSLTMYLEEKKHDALKLKVRNSGGQDQVLNALVISWPEEHLYLKEAKFSGDKFVQGPITWDDSSSTFLEEVFVSTAQKRTLEAGKEETVEIKFEKHVHDSPQIYNVEVKFGPDCVLTYQDF